MLGIPRQGNAGVDDTHEQCPKRLEFGLVPPDNELKKAQH